MCLIKTEPLGEYHCRYGMLCPDIASCPLGYHGEGTGRGKKLESLETYLKLAKMAAEYEYRSPEEWIWVEKIDALLKEVQASK